MITQPIRVAIVEDDAVLRGGLRGIIDAGDGLMCAGEYESAEAALEDLACAAPHVLLLDVRLPGMSGLDAVRPLRAAAPAMRILMLTVFEDEATVIQAICNGAVGYLLKTTEPVQLGDAIRAAHAGGSPMSPAVAAFIVRVFQESNQPRSEDKALAAQEKRLLSLLAEGFSYQAAAGQMNISVNTVRNYIRIIYDKLHVHTKSEAVGKALRRKLIR